MGILSRIRNLLREIATRNTPPEPPRMKAAPAPVGRTYFAVDKSAHGLKYSLHKQYPEGL